MGVPKKQPAAKPLADLTREWATAKNMEATGKREAERKRAEILAHPEGKIGYADDFLKIAESSSIPTTAPHLVEDTALTELLRSKRRLGEVTIEGVSLKKAQALAELDPEIAAALAAITTKTPRFDQASKKTGA